MLLISGVKLLSAHIANLRTTTLANRRHMNRIHQLEVTVTRLGSFAQYVLRYTRSLCTWFLVLTFEQERSSAKQKELYKTVQIKAAVPTPTQLLLHIKVRWLSTYVMINHAERNKKVCLRWLCEYLYYVTHSSSCIACWCLRLRDGSTRTWLV